MITAENITDEQIRELLTEADAKRDKALHSDPVDTDALVEWGPIIAACETALGRRRSNAKGGKARARARCAAILNERAERAKENK